jgi:hypothetical protein
MGDKNAYRTLVRKPKGKEPLSRLGRRWENNIKMHVREIICERVD